MNDFEKYLRDNKDSFHREAESSSELWNKIELDLEKKKQGRLQWTFGIAASVALLLSLSTFIKVYFLHEETTAALPLYSYSSAYGDAEMEFIDAVNFQKQQVRTIEISKAHSDLFEPFLNELEVLDTTYDEYVEIINEHGCNDLMMELIIKHYQQKLEILNTLHQELIKIKNHETETDSVQTTLSI